MGLTEFCIDSFTVSLLQGAFGEDMSSFFVTRQVSKTGKYTLQLPNQHGKLEEVVIDDLVPCVNGSPCFAGYTKDGAFWPVLLRKGLAKLWGSYDAPPLEFGDIGGDTSKPRGRLS